VVSFSEEVLLLASAAPVTVIRINSDSQWCPNNSSSSLYSFICRAQNRVSLQAKDRRSANCATQLTNEAT